MPNRIVYGARCTWWDSIDKVGHTPTRPGDLAGRGGLPCCPHCRSVLYEAPSEREWFYGIDRYEAKGHPGYRAKMTWARGRCFPNMEALDAAYAKEPSHD